MEPRLGGRHEGIRHDGGTERMEALHERTDISGGFVGTHRVREGSREVERRSDHAGKVDGSFDSVRSQAGFMGCAIGEGS
jgi:hypothetical protein